MKLENIIFFGMGALVGALPTFFITRSVERKRADEEIAAYKEYVDKKIADLESKIEKTEKPNDSEDVILSESEERSIEQLSENVDNAYTNYCKTRDRINKQSHMSVDEAMETGDPELIEAAEWLEKRDKMEAEGHIKGSDGSPEVISQLTYTGEGEGEYTYHEDFDHISLDWYAGDGILAYGHNCEIDGVEHEMGEIVEKPNFVVGWKWKHHFGDKELFNDDNCVYVRNEFLCCDFEICRDKGSYREVVLGFDTEEEENDESDS